MTNQADEHVCFMLTFLFQAIKIFQYNVQNGEIQELRKMLSTHIKDITSLQKKINTLVSYYLKVAWVHCSVDFRRLGLNRKELTDIACLKDARYM